MKLSSSLRQLRPLCRTAQEGRLLAHPGDHDGAAAFDDLADDTLAGPVSHRHAGLRRGRRAASTCSSRWSRSSVTMPRGSIVLRQDLSAARCNPSGGTGAASWRAPELVEQRGQTPPDPPPCGRAGSDDGASFTPLGFATATSSRGWLTGMVTAPEPAASSRGGSAATHLFRFAEHTPCVARPHNHSAPSRPPAIHPLASSPERISYRASLFHLGPRILGHHRSRRHHRCSRRALPCR